MYENELYHFGVKGMKWGHRKAQYKKTMAAYNEVRNRYKEDYENSRYAAKQRYLANRAKLYGDKSSLNSAARIREMRLKNQYRHDVKSAKKDYLNSVANTKEAKAAKKAKTKQRLRTAGKIAAASAIIGIGAYAASKYIRSKNGQIAIKEGKAAFDHRYSEMIHPLNGFSKEAATRSAAAEQERVRRHIENTNIIGAARNVFRYNAAERKVNRQAAWRAAADATYLKNAVR